MSQIQIRNGYTTAGWKWAEALSYENTMTSFEFELVVLNELLLYILLLWKRGMGKLSGSEQRRMGLAGLTKPALMEFRDKRWRLGGGGGGGP